MTLAMDGSSDGTWPMASLACSLKVSCHRPLPCVVALAYHPRVYTTPAPKGTLPTAASQQQRNARPSTADPAAAPSDDLTVNQDSKSRYSAPDSSLQRPNSSGGTTPPTAALRTSLPSNPQLQQPRSSSQLGTHNSVMHETLSVIDEHITDMRTPRQSFLPGGRNASIQDSESVYSHQPPQRLSYINGHETDEEENHLHTEAEVMTWNQDRVAEYLEDHGVEKQHCEVFREQEITGDVLLHMEQSEIFIKEFELGSVGRRLKTWQKVRALQDEVRAAAAASTISRSARSVSDYSGAADEDRARQASISNDSSRPSTAVPQRASLGPSHYPSSSALASPLQTMTSMTSRPESTARPSAANIRNYQSRRHSSVGSIDSIPPPSSNRFSHHRQSSGPTLAAATARRLSSLQDPPLSAASAGPLYYDGQSVGDVGFGSSSSPNDFDRGYFSGNEVDNRNRRNVLQKKSISGHTRNASAATDSVRHSASYQLPSRTSPESIHEPVSPLVSSASNFFSFNKPSKNRAVSSPQMGGKSGSTLQGPVSPVVTKLDYLDSPAAAGSETSSVNPSPSPASNTFSFLTKQRLGGLRVASDSVAQNEKRSTSALKGSPITSPTRTGSTTPSTGAGSFEKPRSDDKSRVSTGSSSALAPPIITSNARPKAKSKKTTSAYTRGLEKKAPAEQMADCDYSGWMKKKSSGIVGSWKPRLFVLRGRRLSYYYSEDDTEEKGLIDISSHRVLPAENETFTGLHAALRGASSSSTSQSAGTRTTAATDMAANPPKSPLVDNQLFIFKLVPPRQGLSKAVNFTKPTVHYFAVNSRQEGRLWMAALMKATIDYDSAGKVTTSYNQKTISLAKARARKERPPALQEVAGVDANKASPAELEGEGLPGLGIGGMDSSAAPSEYSAAGGAEQEGTSVDGSINGREALSTA